MNRSTAARDEQQRRIRGAGWIRETIRLRRRHLAALAMVLRRRAGGVGLGLSAAPGERSDGSVRDVTGAYPGYRYTRPCRAGG
jgi:hypothetical protein